MIIELVISATRQGAGINYGDGWNMLLLNNCRLSEKLIYKECKNFKHAFDSLSLHFSLNYFSNSDQFCILSVCVTFMEICLPSFFFADMFSFFSNAAKRSFSYRFSS